MATSAGKSHDIIQVTGLQVNRYNARVLQDVQWHVKKGEHWVILGPNGAGKTTLLSCLLAYVPPSAGTIDVLGERWGQYDWRKLRERVGLVSSSLLTRIPDKDPAVEVVIGGAHAQMGLRGMTFSQEEEHEAREHLEKLGVSYLADRAWGVLSQGERQRVLIARALMPKPALLIVDEPCGGLDPVSRERFIQQLDRLAQDVDAPSLVLVTHHIEEITPSFNHVLLLKDGKTYATGTTDALITSETLSEVFDAKLTVEKHDGRFHLAGVALTSS